MLFRYKVVKCCYDSIDYTCYGPGVGYKVIVHYYKPNAKIFQWRCFATHNLSYIMNYLGHSIDDIDTNVGLFKTLNKYENIGEIMLKYIAKTIEENNYAKLVDRIGDDIDKFVVKQDWNIIEIKENE